jgi:hypothetical protein
MSWQSDDAVKQSDLESHRFLAMRSASFKLCRTLAVAIAGNFDH